MFFVDTMLFELSWENCGNLQHQTLWSNQMTIILSEQEKIELADAQNNGYLFKNVMSEFSGQKEECPVCHKKKVEMFRTSEQIVFLQHWKNCSLSLRPFYHMIKGGCGNS